MEGWMNRERTQMTFMQENYSAWYYNGGYMPLYKFNVQNSEP
jgi:hypothetical protein